MVLILVSTIVVWNTSISLQNKEGLPPLNQIISCSILVISFLMLYLSPNSYPTFLVILFSNFASTFILLSISYEVLFYVTLSVNLFFWLLLERNRVLEDFSAETIGNDTKGGYRAMGLLDLRTSLFYLYFCYVAFFGTGNVASISSFSIESTYRFTTVFDPFIMGGLLVWKILIPFFLVACVYGIIMMLLKNPPLGPFFLIVALSDIMSLNFFFLVQDSGSWLEIGVSISHFAMSNAFIIFQIVLFSVSQILIRGVSIPKSHSQ